MVAGHVGDPYFDDLSSYAAQNEVLREELERLPSGSVYVDVGANLGLTSVMAARVIPLGTLIAIEASPRNFECLRQTLKRTGISNCNAVLCAIGEKEGEIGIVDSEFAAGSYVSESGGVRVPMRTLDCLLDGLGTAAPNLIKIDVEGFELEVLRGCRKLIEDHCPRFVMEFNSYALAANRDSSPRLVLDFIIEHFGRFSFIENGVTHIVRSKQQVLEFLYRNMALHGCIDDIMFGG